MVIFIPITDNTKKKLIQVFYLRHLILFNNSKVSVLLDLGSKVNKINFTFIDNINFLYKKLKLKLKKLIDQFYKYLKYL